MVSWNTVVKKKAYRKVLGQTFNSLALSFVFSVEALGIKLVPETQSLDFTMEPGKIGF
jgi:hypothetical protein